MHYSFHCSFFLLKDSSPVSSPDDLPTAAMTPEGLSQISSNQGQDLPSPTTEGCDSGYEENGETSTSPDDVKTTQQYIGSKPSSPDNLKGVFTFQPPATETFVYQTLNEEVVLESDKPAKSLEHDDWQYNKDNSCTKVVFNHDVASVVCQPCIEPSEAVFADDSTPHRSNQKHNGVIVIEPLVEPAEPTRNVEDFDISFLESLDHPEPVFSELDDLKEPSVKTDLLVLSPLEEVTLDSSEYVPKPIVEFDDVVEPSINKENDSLVLEQLPVPAVEILSSSTKSCLLYTSPSPRDS